MKKKSLLSVVIPVFNVKDYLPKTLDCILAQSYSDWELILVDDGSTDGSLEVEKSYSYRDERIKVYQRDIQPKGAPCCRNIGLNKAKGKYLIYLDSDDIIAPYCFQQRVDYIEANDCDFAVFPIVGFYNKLFDAKGVVYGFKPQGDPTYSLLARTLPFVVVSNIYKRNLLIDKGIFWDLGLKSFQDSDYNLNALRSGLSYKIANSLPDYFYRLSAQNSICKKLGKASNCLSQVGFLEKQELIYGNKRPYTSALNICAAQVLQNIFNCEDRGPVLENYLSVGLFKKKPILKMKIKIAGKLYSKWSNEHIFTLVQSLLYPLFYLRFKFCFRRWEKQRLIQFSELKEMYDNSVKE